MRVFNARKELSEEVIQVRSLGELKGRLDNAWLSVFGDDSV